MNIKASPDVAAYLESRNPADADLRGTRQELAALKALDAGQDDRIVISLTGFSSPAIQSGTRPTSQGDPEARLGQPQAQPFGHACLLSGSPAYTDDLVALVKDFQAENGLKPDGIVGRGSIRAMTGGDSHADKIDKIVIAMEQRRWLPEDLGPRHVFINQPAFMAYYIEGGQEQFDMRVVVGSPRNQTYFFHDEIETVEYNPYWGVPRSIIVNEMLPKLREDPAYLDNLGYEVSIGGQQVSSTAIDWYTTDSVDVRQPPGRGNALGSLKILFPNSHAIYMHDTPQKSFFERDMRALSHGCIRLSDPKKMASAVTGSPISEIEAQIAMGNNHSVNVPQRFPVYVSYFTAWPNKDGVVEYFDDVYSRDSYIRKAIEATNKVAPRRDLTGQPVRPAPGACLSKHVLQPPGSSGRFAFPPGRKHSDPAMMPQDSSWCTDRFKNGCRDQRAVVWPRQPGRRSSRDRCDEQAARASDPVIGLAPLDGVDGKRRKLAAMQTSRPAETMMLRPSLAPSPSSRRRPMSSIIASSSAWSRLARSSDAAHPVLPFAGIVGGLQPAVDQRHRFLEHRLPVVVTGPVDAGDPARQPGMDERHASISRRHWLRRRSDRATWTPRMSTRKAEGSKKDGHVLHDRLPKMDT